MKRVGNLYNKICDLSVIMDMYDKSIKVKTRNKEKIEEFNNFYSLNIIQIKDILSAKNYTPGKYNIFFIQEPKIRIIMSQSIEDKILNHLVAKYFLSEVFEPVLIEENCATRIGKGTHYALKLFKKYYNISHNKYKKFYILKFDIEKYFYNIDHQIVKKLIRKRIKDRDAIKMLDKIIDSTDESYINEEIEHLKKVLKTQTIEKNINNLNDRLKEIDNLPFYKKGKGCPIGNMSSQIIATFYLNELDHFIKEKLKIKYYIRYMDDGILIHENKAYLEYCLEMILKMLERYRLSLNRKTKIYSSNEEIEFLGFRFKYHNKIIMKVSNKTKVRFKKRMKCFLINKENINYDNYRSVRDSYIGHLSYGSCYNLLHKNIIDYKFNNKRK